MRLSEAVAAFLADTRVARAETRARLEADERSTLQIESDLRQLLDGSGFDDLTPAQQRNLEKALDVKVLDHFIVAGNHAISFAERGLL